MIGPRSIYFSFISVFFPLLNRNVLRNLLSLHSLVGLPSFTEFYRVFPIRSYLNLFGSIAVAVTLMTRTYLPSFTGFSLLGATVNEFSLDDSGFFVVVVV